MALRKVLRAWFRDLSINRKILVMVMLICTASLVLEFGIHYSFDRMLFRRSIVHDLASLAEAIGYNCEASLIFKDPVDAMKTMASLRAKDSIMAAWIYDQEDVLLAHYIREDVGSDIVHPRLEEEGHFFEEDYVTVYKPVRSHEQEIGKVYIKSDLRLKDFMFKRHLSFTLMMAGANLLLVLLISSRLRNLITEPLSRLSELARRVSRDKDYSARAAKSGNDELGALVDAFNDMLGQIQDRDSALLESKARAENGAREAEEMARTTEMMNLKLAEEIRERREIQNELARYRDHLEDIIRERTRQLAKANEDLKREIAERRHAEANLKILLEEKVALLGEVHHRVKNNLQVVASLLDMSRNRTDNHEALELLSDAYTRVHTMALIHTQLYRTDRVNLIDIGVHCKELIRHLKCLYGRHDVNVSIAEASQARLPVTKAVPCALILNETISNAFKHAFRHASKGKIEISLGRSDQGEFFLTVKDNGSGIPEDLDPAIAETLGFKLVRQLVVKQLRGNISFIRNQGTEIRVKFALEGETREISGEDPKVPAGCSFQPEERPENPSLEREPT